MVATIILERPTASPVELADGVLIPQPDELRQQSVYSKYESLSNMISDTLHVGEWEEEIVASPQTPGGRALLLALQDGKPTALTQDQGAIVRLEGRLAGEVAIVAGRVLSMEEADAHEETTGRPAPRYHKWDFYVKWVRYTDGPLRAQRLHRSHEQQKQEEIGQMAAAIREAFQGAMLGKPVTADPQQALAQMEPEQLKALYEARMAEREQAAFEAQQAKVQAAEELAAEVAAEKAKRNAKVS